MASLITLRRRGHALAGAAEQNRMLDALELPRRFGVALRSSGLLPLRPTGIDVLQINLGKVCNQVCSHCHVDAGPDRKESMSDEILDRVLEIFERSPIPTLDVTGGAPELHPRFREILRRGALPGRRVIHRCNLTAIMTKPFWDIPDLLAGLGVEIIASLPHYAKPCTDKQRGDGVFEASIEAIRRLNQLGYGVEGSGRVLNLVSNPVGAVLPGNESAMEIEWKRELLARHGLVFNRLLVLTNLPISRFLEFLVETGSLEQYMTTLVNAYNPKAAAAVMCRNMVSVGWDGQLYDCDFNQMLELPIEGAPRTILEWDFARLQQRAIVIGEHCYGCTAGAGSSCGGQIG